MFRVPRAFQLFQAAPAMRTVPAGLPRDPYDPPAPCEDTCECTAKQLVGSNAP